MKICARFKEVRAALSQNLSQERRFLGFLALTVAVVLLAWAAQLFPRSIKAVAKRDLRPGEYLTATEVAGPGAVLFFGQLLTVAKRSGEVVLPTEVTPLGPEFKIVTWPFRTDRSLGDGLAVGLCVDVWYGQPPAAAIMNASVAAFVPLPPDKRLVSLKVARADAECLQPFVVAAPTTADEQALLVVRQCEAPYDGIPRCMPTNTPTPTRTNTPTPTNTTTPTNTAVVPAPKRKQ